MKLDHLFKHTSLENKVLDIYASHAGQIINEYYTPKRLTLWNQGMTGTILESMAMHEFAHIVDWFLRDKTRLLKPNFGFKLAQSENWSYRNILTETRTVAYQKNLVDYINTHEGANVKIADLNEFYNAFTASNFIDFDTFKTVFASYQNIPGEHLVQIFKDAMNYIKANRNELELPRQKEVAY